jgi:hypothetical protein
MIISEVPVLGTGKTERNQSFVTGLWQKIDKVNFAFYLCVQEIKNEKLEQIQQNAKTKLLQTLTIPVK